MTAVEYFAMITGAWKYASKAQLEEAKEMERKQIIDAHISGYDSSGESAKDYYDFYYGSKASDEHIVDTNEMVSSKTEISDSEINDIADRLGISTIPTTYFIEGAKWYREQLKQK